MPEFAPRSGDHGECVKLGFSASGVAQKRTLLRLRRPDNRD